MSILIRIARVSASRYLSDIMDHVGYCFPDQTLFSTRVELLDFLCYMYIHMEKKKEKLGGDLKKSVSDMLRYNFRIPKH